ncbi:MAG: hypothetical protein WCS73_13255 [Lentisphaeria bacterium]
MSLSACLFPKSQEEKGALLPDYFPVSYQAIIWRNWGLVPVQNIAAVLQAKETQIMAAAALLGLPNKDYNYARMRERAYVTILRKNWHLLDYEGVCTLLGCSQECLEFMLREDDFLWIKLGSLKPIVSHLPKYRPLTDQELRATKDIAGWVKKERAKLPACPEEPFAFLDQFTTGTHPCVPCNATEKLRMVYSYSALYGDPLGDPTLDPFPDSLLAAYAAAGVNAVWMQASLYLLTPWLGEQYAGNWRARIARLRALIERVDRYGIKIILYLNEPRGVPVDWLKEHHPDWIGAVGISGIASFCPENKEMLDALSAAVASLCQSVPGIGGFMAITYSENITHCLSRPESELSQPCPICRKSLTPVSNIVKVLRALYKGLQQGDNPPCLYAHTWAWKEEWGEKIIEALPPEIAILSVSEWELKTNCQGVPGAVCDYSISKPGPGDYSKKFWKCAREKGHRVVAKIQVNNSWECPSLPYVPVAPLIEEHLQNLRAMGVEEFMASWTLGGYPGGNLKLLSQSAQEVCEAEFGTLMAKKVLRIQQCFSDGFRCLPFDGTSLIYFGPLGMGPANLLHLKPTGYKASMVGFPYDDLKSWRGSYSEEVLEAAFVEMNTHIRKGMDLLEQISMDEVPEKFRDSWKQFRSVSEAFYLMMRGSLLQITFIRARDQKDFSAMKKIVQEDQILAEKLMLVQAADSRIGFEATNHYMFLTNDLIEKRIADRAILQKL